MYKDEGHSFLDTENIIDSEVKRVEFLAKVLENWTMSLREGTLPDKATS